jgi:hypothetical protein
MWRVVGVFALVGWWLVALAPPPGAVLASVADPGEPGPLAVAYAEYDLGATAFQPSGFPSPVELLASVHYPRDLTAGPYPLLVLLHGNHAPCSQGDRVLVTWPCPPGWQPIPSYRGYDYLGQALASHGYIVVSISANGINAFSNLPADLGASARGQLVLRHLELWREWTRTTSGPFQGRFQGKVDLQRVGLMGHSRGGEGVVAAALLNAQQRRGFGIRAVWPLAPTDFNRLVLPAVPLAVLLPYCDGDVVDLQGVHYYDDARYAQPGDRAPKHTILVLGANHNYYNTVWTPGLFPASAADDWTDFVPNGASDPHCGTLPGNGRLTPAQQRATAVAYGAAFFRRYVSDDVRFAPLLAGDAPPPASAQTSAIYVSYHAPDLPLARRDLNRYLDPSALATSQVGGSIHALRLRAYSLCGGAPPAPAQCLAGVLVEQQPHTAPSLVPRPGLSQLRLAWGSEGARYRLELPATARTVAHFQRLQFRAALDFADASNPRGLPQDWRVVLTDGAGRSSAVRVGEHSGALFYPPGAVSAVPKVVLNTVRIPLAAFQGVDLHDLRTLEFVFDQRPAGAVLLTDLAFASVGGPQDLAGAAASVPPSGQPGLPSLVAPGQAATVAGAVQGSAVALPGGVSWSLSVPSPPEVAAGTQAVAVLTTTWGVEAFACWPAEPPQPVRCTGRTAGAALQRSAATVVFGPGLTATGVVLGPPPPPAPPPLAPALPARPSPADGPPPPAAPAP